MVYFGVFICFLTTVAYVEAYPDYVQCDLTVEPRKGSSSGQDVMTTTVHIMGRSPATVTTLISGAASWSSNGEAVPLTFGEDIGSRGFIQASAGELAGANKCTNTRFEWSSAPSGTIFWTAPSDGTTSTTISVATASSSWGIQRQQITLTKSAAEAELLL